MRDLAISNWLSSSVSALRGQWNLFSGPLPNSDLRALLFPCTFSKYLADLLHSRPHSWEWRITGLPPILYEGCWLDSQSHWGFGRLELDSSSLSYTTSPSFHLVHIISISVWCVKVECRSKITSTYLDKVYLCFELALLRWAYRWYWFYLLSTRMPYYYL